MQSYSSWNWLIGLFILVLILCAIYAAYRASINNGGDKKELDGWFMLLSVGVYLSPILSVFGIYSLDFVSNSNKNLHGGLIVAVYGEYVINGVLLFMQIVTAVFMVRKSRHFPSMFIATCSYKMIIAPLDFLFVASVVSSVTSKPFWGILNAVATPEAANQWSFMSVFIIAWMMYVKRSRRVESTFIR